VTRITQESRHLNISSKKPVSSFILSAVAIFQSQGFVRLVGLGNSIPSTLKVAFRLKNMYNAVMTIEVEEKEVPRREKKGDVWVQTQEMIKVPALKVLVSMPDQKKADKLKKGQSE